MLPLVFLAATPVVGGSQVPSGKWPDAVAVLGTSGTCTGTLVAPDVVLTAGHCADIDPVRVAVDTPTYTDGGVRVAVAQVIPYPDWKNSYDVAVLVLAQPIEGVAPRALATSCTYDGFARGSEVHLVGYGLDDPTGTGTNTVLREAMATVLDPSCMGGRGCRAQLAPGGEFVAGGDGINSCYGDSGGPVYLDTPRGVFAIGAVSRGVDGASEPCNGGGIYVRTDKIADWIETVTGRTVARDDCAADAQSESAGCSAGQLPGGGVIGLLGMLYASGCGLTRRSGRRVR